jgi:phosphoserine phosphatase
LSQIAGIDLSQSFAYADHTSDLPLLQHVGHPVAVNPSSRLKTFALAHSWPIRRF